MNTKTNSTFGERGARNDGGSSYEATEPRTRQFVIRQQITTSVLFGLPPASLRPGDQPGLAAIAGTQYDPFRRRAVQLDWLTRHKAEEVIGQGNGQLNPAEREINYLQAVIHPQDEEIAVYINKIAETKHEIEETRSPLVDGVERSTSHG
jgi:hypothetical protein